MGLKVAQVRPITFAGVSTEPNTHPDEYSEKHPEPEAVDCLEGMEDEIVGEMMIQVISLLHSLLDELDHL